MIWILDRLSDLLAPLFAPDLIRARAERDAALRLVAAYKESNERLMNAIRESISSNVELRRHILNERGAIRTQEKP